MRILKIDRKEGLVRLSLQALEDLWHLHKILEIGDEVSAKTYRKVAVKRGSEIMEGDKKPVNLTIRLEKSEFHQYTGRLRLSGIIVSGPEDIQLASHHTITVEPGMLLALKKQKIRDFQLERLEKARVKEQNILFVAIDRDQADFGSLKEYGLEMLGSARPTKTEEDDSTGFYEKILRKLESEKDYGRIVLCGPGFERENLFKFIRKQNPELAEKIHLEHSSSTGKPGIQEVLKTSGSKILKETRIARETSFVEKLLLEIKKQSLAVYGKESVKKAVEYRALETLLVSDIKVKEFESLIDSSEKISAKIVLISTEHESGEQLLSLGGIAGLLRFRI